MGDRPAAERACKDPNPIIDGRKANVNLAILGAKPRGNVQPGFPFPGIRAGYPAVLPAQYGSSFPRFEGRSMALRPSEAAWCREAPLSYLVVYCPTTTNLLYRAFLHALYLQQSRMDFELRPNCRKSLSDEEKTSFSFACDDLALTLARHLLPTSLQTEHASLPTL
ncbi:hypothetical protein RUM43_012180 [Polyplax serrata]|uniref:RNA-binding protein 38 n=1 Tax=Polyplax serrata TaxID=468196 RepID=A0AAN8RSR5_POLSC